MIKSTMTQMFRQGIKIARLSSAQQAEPISKLIENQKRAYLYAMLLVKVAYIVMLFLTIEEFVASYDQWGKLADTRLLWPIAWLDLTDPSSGMALMVVLTIATFILSFLFTENRIARIAVFVFFLQAIAMVNSFGKINHNLHGWIMVSFLLIFLPNGRWSTHEKSLTQRHYFLTVVMSTQIGFLFFYSMSGLWKVLWGGVQLVQGEVFHSFHPQALAQQIANRLLQTNSQSLFGEIIIENPWLGFLPYLCAIYLELFSVVVPFRPSLHKFWGLSLILFHLSTWLTMSISFNTNVLLLGLFLVLSPLQSARFSARDIWKNLPLIGDLQFFLAQRKKR